MLSCKEVGFYYVSEKDEIREVRGNALQGIRPFSNSSVSFPCYNVAV